MIRIILENTNRNELLGYVCGQLNFLFPDKYPVDANVLISSFEIALERTDFCFSRIKNKYYYQGSQTVFNYLNGDHYSMFLYFLSNSAHRNSLDKSMCSKIFLLNKSLFGVDAFYEVELPDIFLFVHPISSVLGRARYSNYFIVYQQCNIGSNHDIYPTFSEYVTMHPGSSVLGNCVIGKNCEIGASSLLLDKSIDDNKIYVGGPGNFKLTNRKEFNSIWI